MSWHPRWREPGRASAAARLRVVGNKKAEDRSSALPPTCRGSAMPAMVNDPPSCRRAAPPPVSERRDCRALCQQTAVFTHGTTDYKVPGGGCQGEQWANELGGHHLQRRARKSLHSSGGGSMARCSCSWQTGVQGCSRRLAG